MDREIAEGLASGPPERRGNVPRTGGYVGADRCSSWRKSEAKFRRTGGGWAAPTVLGWTERRLVPLALEGRSEASGGTITGLGVWRKPRGRNQTSNQQLKNLQR